MRFQGKEAGLRGRLGVTTRTIVGGLSVLLMVAAVACEDAQPLPTAIQEPAAATATSPTTPTPTADPTNTPSLAPTKTPTPTLVPTTAPTMQPTPTATPGPTLIPSPSPVKEPAQELRSDRERVAPSATDIDLADLVKGNSAFAFDLYKALSATDGNLFYSPYSISLALAMTYAGTRDETESQMADTLHYLLPRTGCIPRSTPWTWSSPPAEEGRRVKTTRGSG